MPDSQERHPRRLTVSLAIRQATRLPLLADAERTMARMRQIDPTRTISNLADVMGPYGPEELAKYAEGVRKAGLPE